MRGLLLEPAVKHWACPSCALTHTTQQALPHVPMHLCAARAGFSLPFVEAEMVASSRHVLRERDDYIGDEHVQTDVNGRPIMAVHTERTDGSHDTHVYAPAVKLGR